jgi:hypothetical protein
MASACKAFKELNIMNKIDDKATHVGPEARDSASGRRRFVRGVGVAIPVSLTVSARSALSAGLCATVSANASIALANSHNATGDVNQSCEGKDSSQWEEQIASQPTSTQNTQQPALLQSPSAYVGLDQKFGTIFTAPPPLKNSKMSEAVKNQDEFVRCIAAAYLNLVNNKVTGIYSLTQLQAMWNGRYHGYSPLPGSTVIWYEQDIKKYLASTWS